MEGGLLGVKPGVLSVKVTGQGTLISQCRQGVLDATLIDTLDLGQIREIKVPIYSQAADQQYVSSANSLGYDADLITIEGNVYGSAQGYDVQGLDVRSRLTLTNTQVLLSNGTAVYPVFYAGRSQTNASLKKLKVPSVLTVYMTFDGTAWSKTTIDVKMNRLQTVPVVKPTLPGWS